VDFCKIFGDVLLFTITDKTCSKSLQRARSRCPSGCRWPKSENNFRRSSRDSSVPIELIVIFTARRSASKNKISFAWQLVYKELAWKLNYLHNLGSQSAEHLRQFKKIFQICLFHSINSKQVKIKWVTLYKEFRKISIFTSSRFSSRKHSPKYAEIGVSTRTMRWSSLY